MAKQWLKEQTHGVKSCTPNRGSFWCSSLTWSSQLFIHAIMFFLSNIYQIEILFLVNHYFDNNTETYMISKTFKVRKFSL